MTRILVIRLGSMGDVIHALPAVASLKRSFPEAALEWVIHPRWAPLLEGNPFVDELILFDRRGRISESLKRLRRDRYDIAVDFQGLIQSAAIARAARARRVVGLDWSRAREGWASLFYSIRVQTQAAHRVDSCLELAAAAGATELVKEFPLPQGKSEGSLPDGPFVLACPQAGWGSKQWPREAYEHVAASLRERCSIPLVVNDAPDAEPWLRQIRGAVIHLSKLPGLIHATRRATAILAVDSGPLHLAAALDKPGVAIFGPTDPASHGPYGGSIQVLRSPEAVTSYKRRAEIDPGMRAITPDAVMEALSAILSGAAAGKRSA